MQIFIDTLSEPRQQQDKLMKFLHDNNANADNDDSGKLHAESSLRNMKGTYWTKGRRKGWVVGCGRTMSPSLVFPNCLYYRQMGHQGFSGRCVVCLTEVVPGPGGIMTITETADGVGR